MDAPEILLHDGQHEEVDHIEFILKDNHIQKSEEEEEVKEEEELEEEYEGYQTSKEED